MKDGHTRKDNGHRSILGLITIYIFQLKSMFMVALHSEAVFMHKVIMFEHKRGDVNNLMGWLAIAKL